MRAKIRTAGHLKRVLIFLLVLALVPVAYGSLNHAAPPRVYTVAQVEAGIAANPRELIGRTVEVRGVLYPFRHRRRCVPGSFCQPLLFLADSGVADDIPVVMPVDGGSGPTSLLASLQSWPVIGNLIPAPQPVMPYFSQPATYHVLLGTTPCGDEPCVVASLLANS